MNILIFGGAGMLGQALLQTLRGRGHEVRTAGRSACDVNVDFRFEHSVDGFRSIVRGSHIVINCVGILLERSSGDFDAVHHAAPAALFEACALERVARTVHISAIGAGRGIDTRYLQSKEGAEAALQKIFEQSSGDWVAIRPSLLMQKESPSTRLFMALSRLPIAGMPGFFHSGQAQLAPLACSDAAEAIANICENKKALRRVVELTGAALSYRAFLNALRSSQLPHSRPAWTLPIPWWLMHLSAKLAEFFPQKVLSSEGLKVLRSGLVSSQNELSVWLKKPPLSIT